MLNSVLAKVFGTKHARELKRVQPVVDRINALEPEVKALGDAALSAKTTEFQQRLEAGESLDDLLIPAFAAVREAAWRRLSMRHFDVQLIGGIVLHQGKIAEMKTGEGKTLVATLPAYLNALAGKGVHVVTVNDYLARRDSEWMSPVFEALGMSVGVIQTNMPDADRQAAYAADVTYGTNNEFGFDYLRDNMKFEFADIRAARASLRDRRRGRLDPGRRSAHPADHLRAVGRVDRQVLSDRSPHPPLRARRRAPGRGRRQVHAPVISWSTKRPTP